MTRTLRVLLSLTFPLWCIVVPIQLCLWAFVQLPLLILQRLLPFVRIIDVGKNPRKPTSLDAIDVFQGVRPRTIIFCVHSSHNIIIRFVMSCFFL